MSLQKNKTKTEKNHNITEAVLNNLKQMRLSENGINIDYEDMTHYETLKSLSESGYLVRQSRHYQLTEKGSNLLEDIESYLEDSKISVSEGFTVDLNTLYNLKEEKDRKDVVRISYMRKHPTEDLIESHVAVFEKDFDGTPIIVVNPENYLNILNRELGEHWRKYVGEAGRKLIREKKLSKVYLQNESTGRRYLYEVPKK